jgi:hypothetical protein
MSGLVPEHERILAERGEKNDVRTYHPTVTRDAEGAALVAHLRTHAPTYFADLGSNHVGVDLLAMRSHRFSRTYRFRITGSTRGHDVLAKALAVSGRATDALRRDRPRLASVRDWESVRPRLEYRSLSVAFEHFRRLGDPRLGAVRALDYVPELRTIVMEVIDEPTLRRLVWTSARPRPFAKRVDVDRAVRHAGAWLREFHGLPGDENETDTLREDRSDVVDALAAYGRFLEQEVDDARVFADAVGTASIHAPALLPPTLPLGLGHGDFAPRNIFVSAEGRVTVIDMIGRWRVPIYEDLAYFTTALRAAGPQRLTYGLALRRDRLDRLERELLKGYFCDEQVPRGAVRLFELLLLLDKWASFASRRDSEGLAGRAVRAADETLSRRYFLREVNRLVADVAGATA